MRRYDDDGRRAWRHAATIALLVAALAAPAAGETPVEISSLRGIRGVEVRIAELDEELAKAGFHTQRMRVDVVTRLVGRQVPVVGLASSVEGNPVLWVRVRLKRAEAGYVYALSLQLFQQTSLQRAKPKPVSAITWEANAIGLALSGSAEVRDRLRLLTDSFAYDFGLANGSIVPRTSPGTK
jgi:hypothetical protein